MNTFRFGIFTTAMLMSVSVCFAQPPGRDSGRDRDRGERPTADSFVKRLMTLDANKDGSLSKSEVTDSRLQSLFMRADADMNDTVTEKELIDLYTKESAMAQRGPGEDRAGGRDFGGPPPNDFAGPGGPGGRGGRPQPGEILPSFIRDSLQLSPEQSKQLDELQAEVNQRLAKILSEEQQRQLQENLGPVREGRIPRGNDGRRPQ